MVGYFRVSTAEQGRSGLGLEGQAAAVDAHVRSAGCTLLATYTEVETGTKHKSGNRPQLEKAMAHAKRARATLVVAKLDRLSRNVAFLSGLMESGVDFIACDNPNANRLTVHILAAVAEQEARAISDRTKAALAAAKARGFTKDGTPWKRPNQNLTQERRERGAVVSAKVRAASKVEAYQSIVPIIEVIRAENPGISLRAIAKALTDQGEVTRYGCIWNAAAVSRALASQMG